LSTPLRTRVLAGIDDIAPVEWNAIATDYPFLRHEFLHALEASGCAAPATGWTPCHVTLYQGPQLVAAAPVYAKSHSWGEFVFDFAWARAWEARGLSYFPKLVMAVPFTPATGPRMLLHPDHDAPRLQLQVLQAVVAQAAAQQLSSIHALFIDEPLHAAASAAGWLTRSDCHFQWHNRGYRDFDDFLATFAAEKRKKVRRERRRVSEQGIEFETLTGRELNEGLLAQIHAFHAATFIRHGHLPYLTLECLSAMAAGLGEALIVKLARRHGQPIAAALFFRSGTTLYGRYWGADAEFHSLHFEACYYQGIELCIAAGLQRFEPGTQGEHKLARGFEPAITWSAHWVGDAALRAAVATYLRRERAAIDDYAAAAAQHLPFRAETSLTASPPDAE
jgi:uncharacterized protein